MSFTNPNLPGFSHSAYKGMQSEINSYYSQALSGGGLGPPGLGAQRDQLANQGFDAGGLQAQARMQGYLSRFVNPADTKVASFMTNSIKEGVTRQKHDYKLNRFMENATAGKQAFGMGLDTINNALGQQTGMAETYGQYASQMGQLMQGGGPMGELMDGFGGMAGSLMAARMYAQRAGGQ